MNKTRSLYAIEQLKAHGWVMVKQLKGRTRWMKEGRTNRMGEPYVYEVGEGGSIKGGIVGLVEAKYLEDEKDLIPYFTESRMFKP